MTALSTLPTLAAHGATGAGIVTLAERPDLAPAIPRVLSSRWPTFMLAGRPGHDVDLTALAAQAPAHQIMLVDAADRVLGVGLSVPVDWDGTSAGLPAGWDGGVTAGAKLAEGGGAPTAVCALSITLMPEAAGRGYAAAMVEALKSAARDAGVATLIAPVRPVLKSRYPLTPMAKYLSWRTGDGQVFDPWLRLHLAVGGAAVRIAVPSMTITGSVADWESWAGMALLDSGEYVIPGGLVPLRVHRQADTGVYEEPNVWVAHRTTS
jgi:GNAT superfamily N-acetyltransferase